LHRKSDKPILIIELIIEPIAITGDTSAAWRTIVRSFRLALFTDVGFMAREAAQGSRMQRKRGNPEKEKKEGRYRAITFFRFSIYDQ
jgi:hypothetical protein